MEPSGYQDQSFPVLKCTKCGHEWYPRGKKPVQCPKCKTYKWETADGEA